MGFMSYVSVFLLFIFIFIFLYIVVVVIFYTRYIKMILS